MLGDAVPAAPWTVTTLPTCARREADEHTLRHHGKPVETRTGPYGLSVLLDACAHLNATGGKPALPVKRKPDSEQTELFH